MIVRAKPYRAHRCTHTRETIVQKRTVTLPSHSASHSRMRGATKQMKVNCTGLCVCLCERHEKQRGFIMLVIKPVGVVLWLTDKLVVGWFFGTIVSPCFSAVHGHRGHAQQVHEGVTARSSHRCFCCCIWPKCCAFSDDTWFWHVSCTIYQHMICDSLFVHS